MSNRELISVVATTVKAGELKLPQPDFQKLRGKLFPEAPADDTSHQPLPRAEVLKLREQLGVTAFSSKAEIEAAVRRQFAPSDKQIQESLAKLTFLGPEQIEESTAQTIREARITDKEVQWYVTSLGASQDDYRANIAAAQLDIEKRT